MSQHTETELKLACPSEEMWEAVWSSPWLKALEVPDSRKTEDMEARYYDTPTLAFRKEKLAFRIRKEGEEGSVGTFTLIYGNDGWDVIADWSYSAETEAQMEQIQRGASELATAIEIKYGA